MESVEKLFKSTMEALGFHPGKQNILVAVSGGPDSMALLHLLWRWDPDHIHVFHLNHGFRPEAVKEQQLVEDVAIDWRLPFHGYVRDVTAYGEAHGLGRQTAAREVRLRLLQECAEATMCSFAALAHHRDDQIETLVMRLLRGTGPHGLRGMETVRGRLLRPLLDIPKAQLVDYCQQYNIPYCHDSSNSSDTYFRNRIRRRVLPLLEAEAPGVGERLLHLRDMITSDDDYLEDVAEHHFSTLAQPAPPGWTLTRQRWAQLPTALQRRVLRKLLQKVLGSSRRVSFDHIETVRTKALQTGPFSLDIPSMVVIGSANTIHAYCQDQYCHNAALQEQQLPIPGYCTGPWGELKAERMAANEAQATMDQGVENLPDAELFDLAALKLPLMVRSRSAGDSMVDFDGHSKKVNRIFIDAKIPSAHRASWPIVCDREKILWIPGVKRSGWGLISSGSEEVIRLRFRPSFDCHDPTAVL